MRRIPSKKPFVKASWYMAYTKPETKSVWSVRKSRRVREWTRKRVVPQNEEKEEKASYQTAKRSVPKEATWDGRSV